MATYTYSSGQAVEKQDKRADLSDLDRQSAPAGDGPNVVQFWRTELGRYEVEFKPWVERCQKIVRRYRDERDEATKYQTRFNILWSNIQLLMPAVYSRSPQPVVERRYLDKDPLGRIASQTLERATETNLEVGRSHEAASQAVLDYLLCGRGQLWSRYEPEYGYATAQITGAQENEAGPDDTQSTGEEADQPDAEVTWEKVCTDYVYWADFAHSAARTWQEVWWVGRRAWLSREEGIARFGSKFARIALKKPELDNSQWGNQKRDRAPKAEVWEIWDKVSQEVFFIAPDMPERILERAPDPLHLQGFFPCPEPLYATLTNGTLVPVPDYVLYQDQAEEIDSLTNRISRITAAIKAVGLYDGSVTELARLLSQNVDNTMIAVQNWLTVAEKGGVAKSMEFMPIKDMAATLLTLFQSREAAKHDLYEITGISDLIRGQGAASATATASRIEGNFASLRLDARRKGVARFMRDHVAITAEIIAEHFSPEMIVQMTGMLPVVMQEIQNLAPPQQPMPALPAPGGAPVQGMAAGQGAGVPVAAPQPPDPQTIAVQVMMQALELLRNDKMRTFRIDIETDSTVEADAVMEKEAVVEFMGAMAQFLTAALPIGQSAPPLIKPFAESVSYAMRRFKMGRSVEAAFDQAFEELEQMSKQPQGGENPQAQVEKAKADAEIQVTMIRAQADQRKAQMDMEIAEQEMQTKRQKLILDQEKMRLEMEMMVARADMQRQKMAMQAMMPAPANEGATNAA